MSSIIQATTTITSPPGASSRTTAFPPRGGAGPPIALALASNLVNNSYKYANGIGAVITRAGRFLCDHVNGVFVKLFDRVLNPREIRRRLGLNQEQFWTQIGVTQSGGSRYESGRDMPKPVRELLRLVHVEQIDLSQVKRVDFEIISYLKESHADLYRSLRRAVRSKHRHPEGEPATVDGDSVMRSYPETADEPTGAN